MSLILLLLVIYITIAFIILIINLIKKYQCKYFSSKLFSNHMKQKSQKNHDYKESIIDLLDSAGISISGVFVSPTSITNGFVINTLCDKLREASGKFHNRAFRCYQWGYKVIKRTLQYSPFQRAEVNYAVRFFIFLLETLLVYLLGLWLDTTGIGNKILNALTDVAKQ